VGVARFALSRGGVAAEQANAPDRRHEPCHVKQRGRAAGDWRRYAALVPVEIFASNSMMTEPMPTEFLRAIISMFPEFEEFWEKEGDIFREGDGSFTYHGLFAVFSHYVRAYYGQMAEGEKGKLFHFIETCMSEEGGSDEVGNAVHTCFIENLAGDLPPDEVRKYVRPNALKAFKHYDA
jgi:hypothetical protein